MSTQRKLG